MDEAGLRLVEPEQYPVALEHNAREGSRGSPCRVQARSPARRSRRSAPERGPRDSGTRERRGLSDAPKGCSIAHSLIDWRGGSRSTAEDYWTRRKACSIARRRCSERGRRPLRLYGYRRAAGRPHAASTEHERTTALESRVMLACGPLDSGRPRPKGRTGQQSSEGSAGSRDALLAEWTEFTIRLPQGSKSNQQKNKIVALGSAQTHAAKS